MAVEGSINLKDFFEIDELYKLIDRFIKSISKIFKIKFGFLFFINRVEDNFEILKIFGVPDSYLDGFNIRKSVTFLNICREKNYIELNKRFYSIFPEFERLQKLGFKRVYILKVGNTIYGGLTVGGIAGTKLNSLSRFFEKNNPNICLLIDNLLYKSILKRTQWERHVELEVGRKLSGTMDLYHALNYMLDKIKEVVNFDAAGIFLIQEKEKKIEYKVLRGYETGNIEKVDLKIGTGLVGWSAKCGKGLIVGDVRKNKKYIEARKQTKSQIVIPLYVGGHVKGVLNLESDKINSFTKEHYDYLETIANITGIFIENFRLNYEYIKKKELEKDLKIANDIQKALLPYKLPRLNRYKLARFFKPSQKIGGDLYDVIQFAGKKLGIAVGDISGKGISGAILMASFYSIFKSHLREDVLPNQFIKYLNNEFRKVVEVGNYATFFYGILHFKENRFFYTNAGHNPPVLVKRNGGVKFLNEGGIVLGYLKDVDYELNSVQLDSGDYIVFYTDGITEAKNDSDEEFGEERLKLLILKNRDKEPNLLKNLIREELDKFCNSDGNLDDLTLLILKREN